MRYQTISGQIIDAFLLHESVRIHAPDRTIYGYAGDYLVIRSGKEGIIDIMSPELFNIAFVPVTSNAHIETQLDEDSILKSAEEFDKRYSGDNAVYDQEGMPAHPYVNADKQTNEEE